MAIVDPALSQDEWARVLPGMALEGANVGNPHGLAARALYGQPFGFSRLMLAALRYRLALILRLQIRLTDICVLLHEYGPASDRPDAAARNRAAVDALIAQVVARVAALMPPDEPWRAEDASEEGISPALSAAGWATVAPGEGLTGYIPPTHPTRDEAHALAARALYGQPFGFTRAQLAALRHMDERGPGPTEADVEALGGPHCLLAERLGEEITDAATRISALLPAAGDPSAAEAFAWMRGVCR